MGPWECALSVAQLCTPVGLYKETLNAHLLKCKPCRKGLKQICGGKTVLLSKIETLKRAKLTHDKWRSSSPGGEKKVLPFWNETRAWLIAKLTFPSAKLGANRVGDFTSSLHKRLPNSLQQTLRNKNVKYILAGGDGSLRVSIKGLQ